MLEVIYECPHLVNTERGQICPIKKKYEKDLVEYERNLIDNKVFNVMPELLCPEDIRIENGQKICMVVQNDGE